MAFVPERLACFRHDPGNSSLLAPARAGRRDISGDLRSSCGRAELPEEGVEEGAPQGRQDLGLPLARRLGGLRCDAVDSGAALEMAAAQLPETPDAGSAAESATTMHTSGTTHLPLGKRSVPTLCPKSAPGLVLERKRAQSAELRSSLANVDQCVVHLDQMWSKGHIWPQNWPNSGRMWH